MIKVSVIVATRNRESLIRGCLDSVLSQSIIDCTEIIVIDGRSQEKEKQIVAEYKKRHSLINYVLQRNLGLYNAWNLGVRKARGVYLTNLNTDDRLRPDALETMANALDENPNVGLVYGDSYVTLQPNETFKRNSSNGRKLNLPRYSHRELLVHCLCGPHPMWRKEVHDDVGYFDESYKYIGDYEFWLRIAEKWDMLRIRKTLGLYYLNPQGLSTADPEAPRKEKLRIKRKYFSRKLDY